DLFLLENLGRQVAHLSLDLTISRDLLTSRSPRHAEVQDFDDTVGAHENVLRGDVAVDDTEWLTGLGARLVRRVQTVEHTACESCRDRWSNGGPFLTRLG